MAEPKPKRRPIFLGSGNHRVPVGRPVVGVYSFMNYRWYLWEDGPYNDMDESFDGGKGVTYVLYSEEAGLGKVRGQKVSKMWEEIAMSLDLLNGD